MKKISYLFMLVVICFLIGCSPDKTDNYADQIKVVYPDGQEITASWAISVEIINLSPKCIEFPYNFGIKLFANLGQSEVEIKDLSIYGDTRNILLKEYGDWDNKTFLGAMPDTRVLSLTGPTNFTMVLHGQLCDDPNVKVEKKIPFVVNP